VLSPAGDPAVLRPDGQRAAELAGVPEEVMFAGKPQLAGSLIERAHSRGIRAAFVAGTGSGTKGTRHYD
jgi:hypothetical protein